jgi:hypothetical protein
LYGFMEHTGFEAEEMGEAVEAAEASEAIY